MDAFKDFSTSRLFEFEEIPVEWKMPGSIQADLNEGLNNLLENEPGLAVENFTIVIKKDPSVWQAFYYRAAAQKKLGRFRESEADVLKALKLRGDFYEGLVELAKIYHFRGNSSESERAINRAIRMNRTRGTAYYVKGDVNMWQGQVRSAINNYKDCLSVDSLFHDARIKLALLDDHAKRDIDVSIRHLDRVLAYDSMQKTALLFRSILGHETNKKQSVDDLTNLIKVSPFNLMALYLRGVYSAELEDYDHAFNDFRKVIQMTATSDNNFVGKQTGLDKKIDLQNAGAYVITRLYGLGEDDQRKIRQAYCNLVTREYDKGVRILDTVTNGREPVVVYLKAVAYEHKGVHQVAHQLYSLALTLDTEIAEAYKKRGIYRQELKQWDKSVEDFTAVLRIYPDAFITNRMRGVSYYHMNRFADAIADYNAYLENDSLNAEVTGYRGMAYFKSNQRLRAYVDFAASGAQQVLNLKDLKHLIDSVMQIPDTAQVLHCLNVITKAAPDFTEGFVQKFKIHMARNEWKPIQDYITDAVMNRRQDIPKSMHSYLLTLQAMNYSRINRHDDAVRIFNHAVKTDENNDFAYLERGRHYLQQGKKSKAGDDFRKAVVLGQRDSEAIAGDDELVSSHRASYKTISYRYCSLRN